LTSRETGSGLNATTTENRSSIAYDRFNRALGYVAVTTDGYGNRTATTRSAVVYGDLGHLMHYQEDALDPVYDGSARELPRQVVWDALGYNTEGQLTGFHRIEIEADEDGVFSERRVTNTLRTDTLYNAGGQESAYHEFVDQRWGDGAQSVTD